MGRPGGEAQSWIRSERTVRAVARECTAQQLCRARRAERAAGRTHGLAPQPLSSPPSGASENSGHLNSCTPGRELDCAGDGRERPTTIRQTAPARARARSDNITDPTRETPISDASIQRACAGVLAVGGTLHTTRTLDRREFLSVLVACRAWATRLEGHSASSRSRMNEVPAPVSVASAPPSTRRGDAVQV